jgi:hypothetical protein
VFFDVEEKVRMNKNSVAHASTEISQASRFSAILTQDQRPRANHDTVLFEESGCLVTPTLGSILPYWLLVIPRQAEANFARWRTAVGCNPTHIIKRVLSRIDVTPSKAIWFEHGAAGTRSSVGCGVDYAHLHILIDPPFDFEEFAQVAHSADTDVVYEEAPTGTSYLVAGTGGIATLATNVDAVGSQFFRKMVANLANNPDAWDYKSYSHSENVNRTVVRFGGAHKALAMQ